LSITTVTTNITRRIKKSWDLHQYKTEVLD